MIENTPAKWSQVIKFFTLCILLSNSACSSSGSLSEGGFSEIEKELRGPHGNEVAQRLENQYKQEKAQTERQYSQGLFERYASKIEQAKKAGMPIVVYSFRGYSYNCVGGVDIAADFLNISDRILKYVTFDVVPYNAVGDMIQSEIGDRTTVSLHFTGPLNPGLSSRKSPDYPWSATTWTNIWYNKSFDHAAMIGIVVEFMSGETLFITRDDIDKYIILH